MDRFSARQTFHFHIRIELTSQLHWNTPQAEWETRLALIPLDRACSGPVPSRPSLLWSCSQQTEPALVLFPADRACSSPVPSRPSLLWSCSQQTEPALVLFPADRACSGPVPSRPSLL
uniref:Uncharacterized protein n=1 Tax=Knipowitschia caucasica TaxID=637954 RepID=A0AAV2KQV3_KNICA